MGLKFKTGDSVMKKNYLNPKTYNFSGATEDHYPI